MVSEHDSSKLRRWFSFGVVVVVLLVIGLILWPLALPILWAAILGFLMFPLQQKLTHRFGGRRSAAAGVLTGLTPIAIFVPLSLIAIAFANQVATLTTALQQDAGMFDLASWIDPAQ